MKIPKIHGSFLRTLFVLVMAAQIGASTARAQVAAPLFAPSSADSTVAMEVTITCPTAGAEIRYTLNGEEPTIYDPVVTNGGTITISRHSVLKARAWSGATAGPVTSEDYRITGAISCGYQHGLALSVAGRIWSWGEQAGGRLGNGLTSGAEVVTPARVQLGAGYFDTGSLIAAGYDHSLVIDQDGNLWSFGENGDGQLGNNSTTDSGTPVRVLKSTTAGDYLGSSIGTDAGQSWSLALLSSGTPVTWGIQSSGRLANGANSSSTRNYAGSVLRGDDPGFPALTGIRQIAAGHGHGLAREPNASEQSGGTGRVWVWGSNTSGQLGLGSTTHCVRAVPMLLNSTTELTDALDVSGGGAHTAVLRWKDGDSDLAGTVWCCGNQSNGRLGNGSTSSADIKYPVRVIKVDSNPLTGIRQVSAGPTHTLAVDADGHVWAWGNNQYGQLGDGTTSHSGHAKQVKDAAGTGFLQDIVMVSAGGESTNGRSMALAEDGTIWVWGRNDEGQLGNGGTASAISLPVDQGSEIIDEGIPALALQCELVNPEELGSACITVTPSHTGPNGMADIDRVELFIDGCQCATLTGPSWTFDATDLPAGPRVIYGMVHDVNGVRAMSASATVGVVPAGTVVVSPSNGHSRAQTGVSFEYWLNHGETTMELQLEVPGNPTGALTVEVTDADGDPVSVTVTPQGGGQHDVSISLSGHTAPLVMAAYVDAQFSWAGEWFPRALTWQATQPVAAQNSSGAVTLPGTPFRNRETATLRPSEGGDYHVHAQFDIDTFGAPSIEGDYGIVLRGLPDQLSQSTAAGIISADFSFHIPSFTLGGGRIRLDLVRLSDGAVTSSTEISPGPAGSGGGLDQGSLQWKRQTIGTALVAVARTDCDTCDAESASETTSYVANEGDACSTGYTNPDSTSDYGVDNTFDMGSTGGGAGGANADFQYDDLENSTVASPSSMNLSATEGAVVTADSTASYAQTVVTATGTTTVEDVTSSGYTLVFTGTGQTSPTTKLRIERNVLSANSWSLRFIEQRYLGTVVETRYEQTKVADGSQIWKMLQGAELTALSDPAAPENSFLRRTTINRGVEQIVAVTPLRGTQVVRVPQRIETVTKAEMTADTGVWETVTSTRNTYRIFPWGDPLVEQVLDPGGRALTKRWDYYTQPGDYLDGADPGGPTGARPGLVSGTLDYDGYWQHFEWDSDGRLAKVRSPFLNSAQSAGDSACDVWSFTYDGDERREVHRIQGVVVGEILVEGPQTARSEHRLALPGAGRAAPAR